MKLSTLLNSVDGAIGCMANPEISGVFTRAQSVTPGSLFIAVNGFSADGHDFIPEAVRNGAVAVVAEWPVDAGVPVAVVPNTRQAVGPIAAAFYGNPADDLCLIGITGTNGKTTTSYLVESMLTLAGHCVGVMGTVNVRYQDQVVPAPMTTPDALELQQTLHAMRLAGVTHVVMEVSSHAIDLHRLAGCGFDIRAFTNLSQDHLDYHGDMAAYRICKERFFSAVFESSNVTVKPGLVFNTADPVGKTLADTYAGTCLRVGPDEADGLHAATVSFNLDGVRGELVFGGNRIGFSSALAGRFNLENILVAAGIAQTAGLSLGEIAAGITAFSAVPGRLERIADRCGRYVFVDYAHTPDALEKVLLGIKQVKDGRLISVFGCGGDRDRSKRPQMGRIGTMLSDVAIVTSDNPRTEDPLAIISDIRSGIDTVVCRELTVDPDVCGPSDTEGGGFLVEPDRRRAIRLGMKLARPGDAVLIAGKGHETYQIIGKTKHPFDDRDEARKALAE
ncbi:MAG: UDP-N-acetylmuramoyl-L-alanyl-D-glutamate--2,6-diaminopimelate ligase [Deltaproteobacteria bacterium]|nr:MAG: UDP-N-acetylmuramoyl-L-alanyl-D-glutamate--2,6-diaminopimelate ligase [Deltaproteobacteria bacterium]